MPLTPNQLAVEIKRKARDLGFDLVGIAAADPSIYRDYFRNWLSAGRQGEMQYLADRFDERMDPSRYLPGARSVVCVAVNYNQPVEPAAGPMGRVARYAWGDDYHDHIKPRLYAIADWIREQVPGAKTRCGVDTAPVMEKELAARAGIGWIGKHTCVINPDIGSWLLLGEVLTTIELPCDEPVSDRCGTCTRCIEACPTGAIDAECQLDATRCISYLTIEHTGEVAPALRQQVGDWLFGCDICQEVCPWNTGAPEATDPHVRPREHAVGIDPRRVLGWDEHEANPLTSGTALKRVKLPVLKRNATMVLNNLQRKEST